MFQDREEAGLLLAERLKAYRGDPNTLILALPRGGVAVGYTLSLALHLPLDVLITRKIGAPGNPEYALGAIAETGALVLNQEAMRAFSLSKEDLDKPIRAQQEEIARRQALYRSGRPLPPLKGRTVLLVDDGIATGSTFFASVDALTRLHPMRLVGAIPVGPRDTLIRLGQQVDELIVLMMPEFFYAVGNHYADFTQVEDATVVRYLAEAASALRAAHRPSPAS